MRRTRSQGGPPTTPKKTNDAQPESPAKRKKSPSGTGAIPKSPMTCNQDNGSSKLQSTCKGCNWTGTVLRQHLRRSPECQASYDMDALEAEAKRKNRENMAAINRRRYQDDPEEAQRKRSASRESYKHNSPLKRAASREYYEHNSPQKKATMTKYNRKTAAVRAENRKLKFEKMTEKQRFMKFHEEMKDVCGYGCICCHRVLTNIKDSRIKIKGGLETIRRNLKKMHPNQEIFDRCFLEKKMLPKGLLNGEDCYLCDTCSRWLKKGKMPPMCYKNGLQIDEIPPELEEINDLEATLIAKNILFMKIFHMPTSRWQKTKDKTVNVPIDDDTILETLNDVTAFPRLPNEAGLIPIDLKRMKNLKTTHAHSYINPEKMIKAILKLKQLGHPGYTDIKIENKYPVHSGDPQENDESEEEEDDEAMDCIHTG